MLSGTARFSLHYLDWDLGVMFLFLQILCDFPGFLVSWGQNQGPDLLIIVVLLYVKQILSNLAILWLCTCVVRPYLSSLLLADLTLYYITY
ncbi:hypothetical protein F5Y01DRAFT_271223 [Xylaria sp. FL0043]|nr:hypothetical protein F5Y01DRAFT_271223 [Xylaria sp. FL0043]